VHLFSNQTFIWETAMMRTIEQPADLGGEALSELKDWLGISQPGEDALLVEMLVASLAMCEAFTGQVPLEQRIEERMTAQAGRYFLTSRPVKSSVSVEAVQADDMRTTVSSDGYRFEVDASGVASIDLQHSTDAQFVAVQVIAGIAASWPGVPKALRQGIIRLAAHYYRDRNHESATQPPASVTALWRPWPLMRPT